MKRTLVLLALAVSGSALSQQLPSDVPSNHWASPAVSKLYELGILQGYPDGLFRGTRPVSRFEMAEALNKFFAQGKSVTDDLQTQINSLKSDRLSSPTLMGPDSALRDRLTALGLEVDRLSPMGEELSDLKGTYSSLLEQVRSLRATVKETKLPDLSKKAG